MNGAVKMFDRTRGFGFIATDAGASVFFHISQWQATLADAKPVEGERVSFEIEQSDRGPRATSLARV